MNCTLSVDRAMVDRQRAVHERADLHLPILDVGLLHARADRENAGLRRIDDRTEALNPVHEHSATFKSF